MARKEAGSEGNEWLTTTQAGKLLGISGMTVGRMCDDGRLEHTRPAGTQRRIHRSVVQAYLESVTHKAKAPKPPPSPTPMPPKPVLRERKRPEIYEQIRRLAKKEL